MNFDIKTEQMSDDAYVISLAGEVDLYTAPEFKQQLLEVIGQGGKDVIVDFTNTTFIDSTTLGVLVGGVKRLRSNEGQLSLVCSDRNITKIFEITGVGTAVSGNTDKGHGKQLFLENCASCHTLAEAKSQGKIGPDLDASFRPDRKQGFQESTIRQVVADQIRFPG